MRWTGLVLAVVALVAGTVLVLARQTGPGAPSTIWAEDGEVFLAQARDGSLWSTLTTSYAGYWHALPRLLAEVAAATPLDDAAAVLAVSAALVQSALALFVYRASVGIVPSAPRRALLAAAVLLVPVGQAEVFASVANLHWFLLAASVWALLWTTERRWELTLAAIVLVCTAGSDPLAVALVPLALLRLRITPRGWVAMPAVAFIATVVVHLSAVVLVRPGRGISSGDAGLGRVTAWLFIDVPGRGLLGTRWLDVRDHPATLVLAAAASLLVALGLALAVRGAGWRAAPALGLIATAAVLYLLPVAFAGMSPGRYSVAPVLLLLGALWSASSVVPLGRHRGAAAVCIAGLMCVWGVNFRVDNERSEGPRWRAALDHAAEGCTDASSMTTVPITPDGWSVAIACRDLPHHPRG